MRRVLLLLCGLLVSSCTTVDIVNPPAPRMVSKPIRWRADADCIRADPVKIGDTRDALALGCLGSHPKREHDFVAVAMSGGGTKAAVFSAEAMFYLEALGLLHRVDVISSVSGGSFTASFYALSCDPGDARNQVCANDPKRPAWNHAQTLKTVGQGYSPLATEQVARWLVPFLPGTISSGRFSSYIDRNFLEGRQFKFRDLNPRRPYLALNSTILSPNRGGLGGSRYNAMACFDDPPGYKRGWLRRRAPDEFFHFAYTDLYFDLLRSNLGDFPVSAAVAASAAYPVLIDPETLTDNCREVADTNRTITLMDGGINDNQGITEIYHILTELVLGQRRSDVPPEQQEKLGRNDTAFVFVINSSVADTTGPSASGGGMGPVGVIGFVSDVVRKISAASDAMGATNFNVRKAFYEDEIERAGRVPGTAAIRALDVGLDKLDQYPLGGAIYALWQKSGLIDAVSTRDDPGAARTQEFGRAERMLRARAALQATVSENLVHNADARKSLHLSDYHPQCYYDIRAQMDASLLTLPDDVQACLREAARWSVALSAEELCVQGNSQPEGLKCQRRLVQMTDALALGNADDLPGHCAAVLDPIIKSAPPRQDQASQAQHAEDCQRLPGSMPEGLPHSALPQ